MIVTAVSWFLVGHVYFEPYARSRSTVIERMTSKGECVEVIAALKDAGATVDNLKCVQITVTERAEPRK